jgi:hypothetical protein
VSAVLRELKETEIKDKRADYEARADKGAKCGDLKALAAAGEKFAVIYADPPWEFKVYRGKGKQRSAERYYDTSSIEAIKALPVAPLAADDCALFMWAVMPELPGALEVIKAWGFEYKTAGFTWVKQNKSGEGLFTGMGYWTRFCSATKSGRRASPGRCPRVSARTGQSAANMGWLPKYG